MARAVIRSPAALAADPGRIHTAVVIDVLRATSTATVLIARGIERIDVVATPASLAAIPDTLDTRDILIISEMAAGRGDRAWIDNSPVEVGRADLAGRRLVMVTTNGTRSLALAAERADRVLLASFLNVGAVARFLAADALPVWIVPAGKVERNEERTEDSECAAALEALLCGENAMLEDRVARVRSDALVQRRLQKEGQAFAADLELCLSSDRHPVVPRFFRDSAAHGHVVRAA